MNSWDYKSSDNRRLTNTLNCYFSSISEFLHQQRITINNKYWKEKNNRTGTTRQRVWKQNKIEFSIFFFFFLNGLSGVVGYNHFEVSAFFPISQNVYWINTKSFSLPYFDARTVDEAHRSKIKNSILFRFQTRCLAVFVRLFFSFQY